MGLCRNIRRVPIFGLGCVAGAAAISRAADYVRAYPDQAALVLSVELCSLTLQREGRVNGQPDFAGCSETAPPR